MWRLISSASFSHSITSISMALMDTCSRATEHISTLSCLVQQAKRSTETIVCRIYIYTPSLHDQHSRHIWPSKINHLTPLLSTDTYTQRMRPINYKLSLSNWMATGSCFSESGEGPSVTVALSGPHSRETQVMNAPSDTDHLTSIQKDSTSLCVRKHTHTHPTNYIGTHTQYHTENVCLFITNKVCYRPNHPTKGRLCNWWRHLQSKYNIVRYTRFTFSLLPCLSNNCIVWL